MLVEDTSAFIEQLEVGEGDRRIEKHRRRAAQAELELLTLERDARIAAEALREMTSLLAELKSSALAAESWGRRLLRERRVRVLERQMGSLRSLLASSREEIVRRRRRHRVLAQRVDEVVASQERVRHFRLHSATHYLECSEPRFVRLLQRQSRTPVLVARRDDRQWWWYRNRFWWDDERLPRATVASLVVDGDLAVRQEAEAASRARAKIFGYESLPGFRKSA
jgi:hypothetical protein